MLNDELRKNCPMRHETGNCLPIGGFCTVVHDCICIGLHNAYSHGMNDAYKSIKDTLSQDKNKENTNNE